MQWDYKVQSHNDTHGSFEKYLTAQGTEGWELISCTSGKDYWVHHCIFKRSRNNRPRSSTG